MMIAHGLLRALTVGRQEVRNPSVARSSPIGCSQESGHSGMVTSRAVSVVLVGGALLLGCAIDQGGLGEDPLDAAVAIPDGSTDRISTPHPPGPDSADASAVDPDGASRDPAEDSSADAGDARNTFDGASDVAEEPGDAGEAPMDGTPEASDGATGASESGTDSPDESTLPLDGAMDAPNDQGPPPLTCPSMDGLFCGSNGIGGDSNTLYCCARGTATVAQVCGRGGCRLGPSAYDRCASQTSCPGGNGPVCGGNGVAGCPNTLYDCTGAGDLSNAIICKKGCMRYPPAINDVCIK
jgi:hypothetical protein